MQVIVFSAAGLIVEIPKSAIYIGKKTLVSTGKGRKE